MIFPFPKFVAQIRHLISDPWTRWVGVRYLKSKKSSRFLSFITVLSVAGVTLGVTAMIVVLSVMEGFETELKKRLMSSDSHILITPTFNAPEFSDGAIPQKSTGALKLEVALEGRSDFVSVSPVLGAEAILRHGRRATGVLLKGYSAEKIQKLSADLVETAEPQMLVEMDGGKAIRLPGVLMGQELAYMLGVIPGDRVTLISPKEGQGPLGAVPLMKRFVIEGVYHTGSPEQEIHDVFTSVKNVESFIRRNDVISSWEISVKEFARAPEVARDLAAILPEFRIKDWVQMNSSLFASLKLERIAMFVALAFIIVVASFNIVTTLTLMVLEKRKEISILKAMGARNAQLGAVFLGEGLLIGGVGVFLGTVLAGVICFILKNYEFIQLPDIYYDRNLPVTARPEYFLGVSVCALIIVWLACIYPSQRAAKLAPIEGIRRA